jgi:glycosyltransferase involved in cell wall biosynthesis
VPHGACCIRRRTLLFILIPRVKCAVISLMSEAPAVSVIMAVYNVAGYIVAAVESVLAQTFPDFELIIVDDGSTDGTLQLLGRFESDARMRVVSEPHRGLPFPVCAGIEIAQAPYLAFLDGDDLWERGKLERHVEFFRRHPSADLTFSWSRIVDEQGRDMGLTSRLWTGPISFSELLTDNVIGNGSALMLRREAFLAAGGIDTSLPLCYDVDLWLRISLLRPDNLRAIPEFLTYYRRRPGQLTCNVELMEKNFERVLERARALAPEMAARVQKKAHSNMQRFFAFGSYQNGDYPASLRLLWQSLRAAPLSFLADARNWKMTAAALAGLALPRRWHTFLVRATLPARRA